MDYKRIAELAGQAKSINDVIADIKDDCHNVKLTILLDYEVGEDRIKGQSDALVTMDVAIIAQVLTNALGAIERAIRHEVQGDV